LHEFITGVFYYMHQSIPVSKRKRKYHWNFRLNGYEVNYLI